MQETRRAAQVSPVAATIERLKSKSVTHDGKGAFKSCPASIAVTTHAILKSRKENHRNQRALSLRLRARSLRIEKGKIKCASVWHWHRRFGVICFTQNRSALAYASRRQHQTEASVLLRTLLGSKFASACNDCTQINSNGFRDA
jgi:hypothetical protein